MAHVELKDDNIVVVIGSGAAGGTLAHELTRRGIKVVLLEAGKRQSLEAFSQVPGEAFQQLTWLDPRTQSGSWGVARDSQTCPLGTAKPSVEPRCTGRPLRHVYNPGKFARKRSTAISPALR